MHHPICAAEHDFEEELHDSWLELMVGLLQVYYRGGRAEASYEKVPNIVLFKFFY